MSDSLGVFRAPSLFVGGKKVWGEHGIWWGLLRWLNGSFRSVQVLFPSRVASVDSRRVHG